MLQTIRKRHFGFLSAVNDKQHLHCLDYRCQDGGGVSGYGDCGGVQDDHSQHCYKITTTHPFSINNQMHPISNMCMAQIHPYGRSKQPESQQHELTKQQQKNVEKILIKAAGPVHDHIL
jgi:hypothetical protein